ncbi:S9 family peptidase [Sphingomonas colocasiae]|uniref:Prolyl oligopeptidase family serine peptidase n=1 Tax=Sphingomonas colocasiae TaxID=1848973 RepID=A0ABS7PY56_9SPHN|nr:prolyl oligopeptidase family serine peptidase [Sphingomonas colocasiae]MBY8825585.1 prolyl oligopeptidase family serine peptidase [Sphingomonas colocasiae]
MRGLLLVMTASLVTACPALAQSPQPPGDRPPLTMEALLAAPPPKAPRIVLDAKDDVHRLDALAAKLPNSAECGHPISASAALSLACEGTGGSIQFWQAGAKSPARVVELGRGERSVGVEWSWDGERAFVLVQAAEDGARQTDILDTRNVPSLARSALIIVDLAGRRAPDRRDLEGSVLQIAPHGEDRIYYASFDFTRLPLETQIRRIDLASGRDERIYGTGGTFQTSRVAVSPDGRHILFAVDRANRRWDDYTNLLLIDVATGREVGVVSGDAAVNSGSWYGWSKDGTRVFFSARHGGFDQIMAATLSGKLTRLTDDEVARYRLVASPDAGFLAYQTESLAGQREIRRLSLNTGNEQSVGIIDALASRFALTDARMTWWRTRDGRSIAGFLFLPAGYESGRRYPVIVDIHGGGRGQKLVMASPLTLVTAPGVGEWYAWAALGYAVFVPDYRSSGAYGPIGPIPDGCCDDGVVHRDASDVADGIDALADQGIVDPERVGLLGHSAGGARVIDLLARSRRYAAAVVNESVAPDPLFNYINMAHGRATGVDALARMTPDGLTKPRPEALVQAKLLSAYRSGTPTLVMLGNETKGATANLTGELLFSLLKENGVASRLIRFEKDGHVLMTPESSLRAFGEVRSWYDLYLKPRL